MKRERGFVVVFLGVCVFLSVSGSGAARERELYSFSMRLSKAVSGGCRKKSARERERDRESKEEEVDERKTNEKNEKQTKKKKSRILSIAIPAAPPALGPFPSTRATRRPGSLVLKSESSYLKNAALVATATRDSMALFPGGGRMSACERDVAFTPGASSTTEHELRCTRRAPGAMFFMEREKELVSLGRERRALTRKGEREKEERGKKKLVRDRERR